MQNPCVLAEVIEITRIGLGGGCHWCTEGVFVGLDGVERVEQGWIAADPPFGAPSEAVIVHFNPQKIRLETLISVHLQTHSATNSHPLRGKYRSAVYYFSEEQRRESEQILSKFGRVPDQPLLTKTLPFRTFTPSLPEHRDYYRSDPERPFCRRYITPKIERLRASQPTFF
ncbi:peptide-methionine (S)-S-oxide reductase [Lewinella sp. IMCC34191]|uniref:peptide-methionine (S)-S-oxide reductase n=1 Tax=Lewinella sp. IMCC34191 TaxID=2259172 RepID=UPI000E2617FC